jgi:nitrite reductase/ring-hydroxylating ferredoxin subunit
MSGYHEVCLLADLPDPGARGFEVDGVAGFVVRRGDALHGYVDRCPHTGVPLAWAPNSYLDAAGELVQCSLHGALFVPDTGECIHGPCLGRFLTPLPLVLEHGRILVHDDALADVE